MKIRPEHLAHIREVITQFDTDFHRSPMPLPAATSATAGICCATG